MTNTDAMTREKGRDVQVAHISWIKKIQVALETDKQLAASNKILLEGDDAATSSGTALPIMRKIAQKFVKNRVGFKIMQLVLFSRGHSILPPSCERPVGTANWKLPSALRVVLYTPESCTVCTVLLRHWQARATVVHSLVRWWRGHLEPNIDLNGILDGIARSF
jgi:hypothetical protein